MLLTAMESWASERYRLDSLLMWHELQGVSRDSVRRGTDEGRAPVDFFVSSIAHMALLLIASLLIAALMPQARVRAVVIAATALLVIPASYRLAVKNMVDWAQSVKAIGKPGQGRSGRRTGAAYSREARRRAKDVAAALLGRRTEPIEVPREIQPVPAADGGNTTRAREWCMG